MHGQGLKRLDGFEEPWELLMWKVRPHDYIYIPSSFIVKASEDARGIATNWDGRYLAGYLQLSSS